MTKHLWTGVVVAAGLMTIGCQNQKQSRSTDSQTAPVSDVDLANRVRTAINSRMMSAPLQPRDLTVASVDGVVTIRGTVDSYDDRSAIEAAARAVDGVKKLDSELVVGIVRHY